MSNWQDPDFQQEFKEGGGFYKRDRPVLQRLWQAIKDTPGTIIDILGQEPPDMSSSGPSDLGDPLAEEAAEGIRDWRAGGVPNPSGEGPMDVGRDEYGVDMPEGGTPRVAERMEVREPLPMEPVEEDQSMTAEMDYVLSGDNGYQRISRFVGLLEDLGVLGAGSAGSDAVPVARKAYEDATGERAPFSSYDSLAQAMEDPAVAEIILSGL